MVAATEYMHTAAQPIALARWVIGLVSLISLYQSADRQSRALVDEL